MKNKFFVKILAIFALFFITLNVFADKGFKIESENENSIKLTWDKDDKSTYYQINYGTDPSNKNSETEAVESNSFEITGLESGKKYYFTLVGLDSSGNETFKSEDLEYNTKNTSSDIFFLNKLELKKENVLRLNFSKNLDYSKISQFEFKVESTKDISDYLKVKEVREVKDDLKSIDLEFDGLPTNGEEYKVVVLAVFDENGNNIKFGVDSEGKFIGGDMVKVYENEKNEVLNAAGALKEDNIKKEKNVKEIEDRKKEREKSISGREVSSESIGKNVEAISTNKEKLPQTGPEIIFLFIIAFMLPLMIYKFKN